MLSGVADAAERSTGGKDLVDGNAIECQGVERRFGTRVAVDQLDLTVPRGSVFGFLGPNGAGKTTTVRMLVGMLRPSAGTIRVFGHDPLSEGEWVRRHSAVMLDNVGLYERLSAWQNLLFAARVAQLTASEGQRRIEEALRRVDLWDRRFDRVSGFSKGMRQKLGLARALLADPELLILDEPTAGLDPSNIVMVRELLVSLAEESERSIFLCTHLLAEAQRICDRVAIIQRGRLLAVGDPNRLGGQGLATVRLTLTGMHPDTAARIALAAHVELSRAEGHDWRAAVSEHDDIEHLVAALVNAGVGVRAVVPEQVSLEDEYMRLVGGEEHV